MTISSSADATKHTLPSKVNLLERKVGWLLENVATPTEPGEPPDRPR